MTFWGVVLVKHFSIKVPWPVMVIVFSSCQHHYVKITITRTTHSLGHSYLFLALALQTPVSKFLAALTFYYYYYRSPLQLYPMKEAHYY